MKLVSCFIPSLLAYLAGKVRVRGERGTEGEGGSLQLEFDVLSQSDACRDRVMRMIILSLTAGSVSM